jgi:hypothetical protein
MSASIPSGIVRLTGRAAVIIGSFVFVISAMNFLLLKLVVEPRWLASPLLHSHVSIAFPYALPISLVLCAFGVSTLLSGIGLIRKDQRARATLEFITWLALISFPVANLAWAYVFLASMRTAQAPIRLAALGIGIAMSVGFAIGFGLALRHLRSERLRKALEESKNGP